ncbi:hypothetical protein PybrP1_010378 [[Pythium] brassicae (nom. inval.)]|nr:hypothetical protein PybrP1_010378 [[Pythium] brassicae (nom. inval.)]
MAARSSEKPSEAAVLRADVTRQAELVAMEFLKSRKCSQTLDAVVQSTRRKSASVVASELFAADLDAKKRAPQEFTSVLEYMVAESSRVAAEALAVVPDAVDDVAGSKPRRRRSSSVSSESSDSGDAVWSKDAVSRLKKAIKQTSRVEDKNERWREIAMLVGKSKKHCYVKYKELKEEKKASGGGAGSSGGSRSSSPSSPSSANRWTSEIRSAESVKVDDTGSGGDAGGRDQAMAAPPSTVPVSAANSWTTSRQAPRKTVSWGETSQSLASPTLESAMELEDVDDFESDQPTTPSTWTQPPRSSSNSSSSSRGASSFASSAGTSIRPSSRASRAPTPQEVASLQQLLFASVTKGFSPHWDQQGFFFSDVANLRYGLVQYEGGPCGVLAVVQAYVLRFLLTSGTSCDWRNPDAAQQETALVAALAHILHQAAGGPTMPCTIALNERVDSRSAPASKRKFLSGVALHPTRTDEETRALLRERIRELTAPKGNGLVLFVVSAVLSKGVAAIESDVDHVEGLSGPTGGSGGGGGGTLVGGHDYCTQEMVNLLLCGQASSNVFDGRQLLDSASFDDPAAVVLKGVSMQASVGFLSLFEAFAYLAVGSHLKSPRFNVWVVCSESHYSVLFAEPALLQDPHLMDRDRLDLFYYDGLANQDEEIRLSLATRALPEAEPPATSVGDLVPPLDLVIRTKWPRARVDWNDTEPLL